MRSKDCLELLHGTDKAFLGDKRLIDFDETLDEVDPDSDKLFLVAAKETKLCLHQCEGVLLHEFFRQGIDSTQIVLVLITL